MAYLCVSQQCCTNTTHIAPTVDQDSLHHPEKQSQRESGNNAQENLLHAAKNKSSERKALWRSDAKMTKNQAVLSRYRITITQGKEVPPIRILLLV